MKKIVLIAGLISSGFAFGQNVVYDIAAKTSYNTTVMNIGNGTAFLVDGAEVIANPSQVNDYEATGQVAGGWKILMGPRERILHDAGDAGVFWGIICKEQNAWPCALIKLPDPGL